MTAHEIETVVRQTLVELMRDNLLGDLGYKMAGSDESLDQWVNSACAHAAAAIERLR